MPAYNYYPGNYQYQYPQYPTYQPYQTTHNAPQYSAATGVQGYQPSQSSIIWISGAMEAQSYPVAPNNAVTLWSTTEPVVYLKQADATGKPTLKVYDLVERTQTASAATSGTDVKSPEYATKDDLGTVVGAVKGLATDIEQIKSDMYGIAGKKKAIKKPKDEEDDE